MEDLIRAYDAFLQEPEGKPSIYNIGGGSANTTSLLEFLDLLADELGGRKDISFEDWREGDQRVYVSDIGRAQAELDWCPQINFKEGIDRYLSWARDDAV